MNKYESFQSDRISDVVEPSLFSSSVVLSENHTVKTDLDKKTVFKNDDAFLSWNGVCYIDKHGNEYTRNDLVLIMKNPDVHDMYAGLAGETPLEYLDDNAWVYARCDRCGAYFKKKDKSIFNHDPEICPFCTPVLTHGKIRLNRDPYEDDRKFYKSMHVIFHEGITVLIGCNGSGKTTLLAQTASFLKSRGVPYLLFDNLSDDGGQKGRSSLLSAALSGMSSNDPFSDIGYALSLHELSEGENIRESLERFAYKISSETERYIKAGYGEFWFLFDAVDSGLSVDMLEQVKKSLLSPLSEKWNGKLKTYFLVSSNSYELAEGLPCFSVSSMKYVSVRSYAAYKKTVYASLVNKRNRDTVFQTKADIHDMPDKFWYDEKLGNNIVGAYYNKDKCPVASLEKCGLKLTLTAYWAKNGIDPKISYVLIDIKTKELLNCKKTVQRFRYDLPLDSRWLADKKKVYDNLTLIIDRALFEQIMEKK